MRILNICVISMLKMLRDNIDYLRAAITKRRGSLKRLSREFVWVVIGQAAALVGGIVGIKLLTSSLGTKGYGELALGQTVALLFNQVLFGPIGQSFFRFFSVFREHKQLSGLFFFLRKLFLWLTPIILILSALIALFLGMSLSGKWGWLILASAGFGLLDGANGIYQIMQNAARQRAIVALHQGMIRWLQPLAAVGMVMLIRQSGSVAMLGFCIGTLAILISQRYFFVRMIFKGKIEKDKNQQLISKTLLRYAYPFAIWGVVTWGQISSDRWALQTFLGEHEVGLYAVLFQLGNMPISLVTGLLIQLSSPIIFERIGDASDANRVHSALRWIGVNVAIFSTFVLLVIAITWSMHGKLFRWTTAQDFWEVSFLLPLVCLGAGLFQLGQIFSIVGQAFNKVQMYIMPKVSVGVLAAVLNFILCRKFGLKGVIMTLIIVGISYSVWTGLLARKLIAERLNIIGGLK